MIGGMRIAAAFLIVVGGLGCTSHSSSSSDASVAKTDEVDKSVAPAREPTVEVVEPPPDEAPSKPELPPPSVEPIEGPPLPWAYDDGFIPDDYLDERVNIHNAAGAEAFVATLAPDGSTPFVFRLKAEAVCEVAESIHAANYGSPSISLFGKVSGVDPACLTKLDPSYLSYNAQPHEDHAMQQRAFFALTRAVPKLRGLGYDGPGGIVGDTTLTQDDLVDIVALPDLQALALFGVDLAPSTAQALTHLSSLRSLELQDDGIGLDSIHILVEGLDLWRFGCDRCELGDDVMREIGKFEQLRALLLDYGKLSDRGLEQLTTLPKLEILDLSGNRDITNAGIAHLAGLYYLRQLRLSETNIHSQALPHLSRLTWLEQLHLSGTAISDEHFEAIGYMVHLRDLDLRDAQISNTAALQLQRLQRLQSLVLAGTFVDSGVLETLAILVELRKLDLANTNVENGLSRLKTLKKLETLDLSKTLVDDPELRKLPALPNLRSVDVSMSRVTEQGADAARRPNLMIFWAGEEEYCSQ
jgi:hypothetical protein